MSTNRIERNGQYIERGVQDGKTEDMESTLVSVE